MEVMYKHARLPKSGKWQADIQLAARKLYQKFINLDVLSLDISDYNKKYLLSKVNNLNRTTQLYGYVLSWAVGSSKVTRGDFTLVDYGGGTGVLSLLAKESGIGTVIYNDIYDVSCRDAKILGETLGIKADHYVPGDIDDLIDFCQKNSIFCHALASYDVLEHIYDVPGFLRKLPALANDTMAVVMSTGANIFNLRVRRAEIKKQIQVEYHGQKEEWGHKERDTARAYLDIRKEMVQNHAPSLTADEVDALAKATRGMIEVDIQACVDEYCKTGQLPPEPTHPTNTCDPHTGNWMEHLMDPFMLRNTLEEAGFKAEVLGGYYTHTKSFKGYVGNLLNLYISAFKNQGLKAAPFYTLYGEK